MTVRRSWKPLLLLPPTAVNCMFGRDGRIRTGGLLLPNQIPGVARQCRMSPCMPFTCDNSG